MCENKMYSVYSVDVSKVLYRNLLILDFGIM